MNYNDKQYKIYSSIKPIVIGVFGRGVGKTEVGIQKAIENEGIFITNIKDGKLRLIKEYGFTDVYTAHEFFESKRISVTNKTIVIDEIDLMNLPMRYIKELLLENFKQLIILGTPQSLSATYEPFEENGEVKFHFKFESMLLQLYFSFLNNEKADCIAASSINIPDVQKKLMTINQYQCQYLVEI